MLVIAADAALRRSLAFVLRAEGFEVEPCQAISDIVGASGSRPCCAVVDDAALVETDSWHRLSAAAEAFVLLVDKARELPAGLSIFTVEKPLLGAAVVEAVNLAVSKLR